MDENDIKKKNTVISGICTTVQNKLLEIYPNWMNMVQKLYKIDHY
jgi:hypothetical protein